MEMINITKSTMLIVFVATAIPCKTLFFIYIFPLNEKINTSTKILYVVM